MSVKDVEEKLRGHRQGMDTLIDRKLSELKEVSEFSCRQKADFFLGDPAAFQESVEQGFTLAKQNRESIQFAMERERESRKASGRVNRRTFGEVL